jgi:hypothetical protein
MAKSKNTTDSKAEALPEADVKMKGEVTDEREESPCAPSVPAEEVIPTAIRLYSSMTFSKNLGHGRSRGVTIHLRKGQVIRDKQLISYVIESKVDFEVLK